MECQRNIGSMHRSRFSEKESACVGDYWDESLRETFHEEMTERPPRNLGYIIIIATTLLRACQKPDALLRNWNVLSHLNTNAI